MRGLGDALAFLGCLFGGAVLAAFLLVAVTAPHFGLIHPSESQRLSHNTFMAAALPSSNGSWGSRWRDHLPSQSTQGGASQSKQHYLGHLLGCCCARHA